MLTKAKITVKIVILTDSFIQSIMIRKTQCFNSLHFLCIRVHINFYKFTI